MQNIQIDTYFQRPRTAFEKTVIQALAWERKETLTPRGMWTIIAIEIHITQQGIQ